VHEHDRYHADCHLFKQTTTVHTVQDDKEAEHMMEFHTWLRSPAGGGRTSHDGVEVDVRRNDSGEEEEESKFERANDAVDINGRERESTGQHGRTSLGKWNLIVASDSSARSARRFDTDRMDVGYSLITHVAGPHRLVLHMVCGPHLDSVTRPRLDSFVVSSASLRVDQRESLTRR
jgi:hypothetical protein